MGLCCAVYACRISSLLSSYTFMSPHPVPSLALGLQEVRRRAHSRLLPGPLPPQHEHHHARLPLGRPLGAPGVIAPGHGATAISYEVEPAAQVLPRRGEEPAAAAAAAAAAAVPLLFFFHGPDAPVLASQQDLVLLERAHAAGLVEEVVVPVQVPEVLPDPARGHDADERVREEGQGDAVPERGDQVQRARHVRCYVGGCELSVLLSRLHGRQGAAFRSSSSSSWGYHLTTSITTTNLPTQPLPPVLALEAPEREGPPVLGPAAELLDLLRYAAGDWHDAGDGEHDERGELAADEQHEGEQGQPADVVAPAAPQQLGRPRGSPRRERGPLGRRRGRVAGRGVVGRDARRRAEGPHQPRVDVDVAEARLVEGQVGLACCEEVCGRAGVWTAGGEG